MTKPTVFGTVIDQRAKTELMDSSQALEDRRVHDLSLMRVDLDKTVDRVSEELGSILLHLTLILSYRFSINKEMIHMALY